jgi:hypothetical protein
MMCHRGMFGYPQPHIKPSSSRQYYVDDYEDQSENPSDDEIDQSEDYYDDNDEEGSQRRDSQSVLYDEGLQPNQSTPQSTLPIDLMNDCCRNEQTLSFCQSRNKAFLAFSLSTTQALETTTQEEDDDSTLTTRRLTFTLKTPIDQDVYTQLWSDFTQVCNTYTTEFNLINDQLLLDQQNEENEEEEEEEEEEEKEEIIDAGQIVSSPNNNNEEK